ncbi:poly-gamma-glutamate hydrolase family protein [Actinoallomurus sp. NPDC052308]|uniref:poly-gamma-glutamate hydrolase family protein n=1 Tax=Actinoallomurus sp. NPDC052308 TaxID=3155530 RepID=UPI00342AE8DD
MKKQLVLGAAGLLALTACGSGPAGRKTARAAPVARGVQVTAGDTYRNYADLARHEKEGLDYKRVQRTPRGANVAQIAIHGGLIESPTSQLADYAASYGHDAYYSFMGIKKSGNQTLHITATHFDEPWALKLVKASKYTVSWHGAKGDRPVTYVGGRDTVLVKKIIKALNAKGFKTAAPASKIEGQDPKNICNRNQRGKGVQLEISTAQRKAFFAGGRLDLAWIANPAHRTKAFYAYVKAVDSVL